MRGTRAADGDLVLISNTRLIRANIVEVGSPVHNYKQLYDLLRKSNFVGRV